VAGEFAVKPGKVRPGPSAAQGVDHEGQGDLIQPRVKGLAGQRGAGTLGPRCCASGC
jgi:hypothetical protein